MSPQLSAAWSQLSPGGADGTAVRALRAAPALRRSSCATSHSERVIEYEGGVGGGEGMASGRRGFPTVKADPGRNSEATPGDVRAHEGEQAVFQ